MGRFLASLFPKGTVAKEIAERLDELKKEVGLIEEDGKLSVVEELVNDILAAYTKDPNSKSLLSTK